MYITYTRRHALRTIELAAALILSLLTLCMESSTSSASPRTDLPSPLTFFSIFGGNQKIYIVDPLGLDARYLITPGLTDYAIVTMAWASDGNKLAVLESGINKTRFNLCIYHVDGTIPLQDCATIDNLYPISLSLPLPDTVNFPIFWGEHDRAVVYLRTCENHVPCLTEYDPTLHASRTVFEFGSLQELTLKSMFRSPKARYLAFYVTQQAEMASGLLQIFDVKSGFKSLVNTLPFSNESCASWNEQENSLVLISEGMLRFFRGDGKPLTTAITIPSGSYACPVAWAHSGTKIAYVGAGTGNSAALNSYDVLTGTITTLVDGFEPVRNIAWSSDDSAIAVDTISSGRVVIFRDGWQKSYEDQLSPLTQPSWKPNP